MVMRGDAEKLDNNSLNGMLEYYGLGSKNDVSYQQITDTFKEYLS